MFRLILVSFVSFLLTVSLTLYAAPTKVAIANLGSHASLLDVIDGIKAKVKELGLEVELDIQHVNFDMTQIPKMLTAQKAGKPDIMVTLTTSVSQHAKTLFRGSNTPIIFAAVTDPVEANLLTSYTTANGNITGVSDQQDSTSIITFIKHYLPQAKRIGIPYAQNEANDRALIASFQHAAKEANIEIMPIPVDSLQDLPHRIRSAASTLDVMYVGPSNMIQPALPVIIQQTNRIKIPVFNFNEGAVKNHQAFGSFAVNYVQSGHYVALIIQQLIKKKTVGTLPPVYPKAADHYGVISTTVAEKLGIKLPEGSYPNVTYVGK